MSFVLIGLCLLVIYLIRYICKYCRDPYQLWFIVGAKGSGKTLFISRLASKHKGPVYSNFGVGVPLASDYYNHDYPRDSLLLIDEAGIVHSNRAFKSFPAEAAEFFKYLRKKQIHVILTSQNLDIDKKIRDTVDRLIIIQRIWFICYYRFYKHKFEPIRDPVTGSVTMGDAERPCGRICFFTIPRTVYKAERFDTQREADRLKVENQKGA